MHKHSEKTACLVYSVTDGKSTRMVIAPCIFEPTALDRGRGIVIKLLCEMHWAFFQPVISWSAKSPSGGSKKVLWIEKTR